MTAQHAWQLRPLASASCGRLPPSAPAVAQFTFGAPESAARFLAEFAAARTFGFESDAPALRARGLALGASLDNAVVFKGDGSAACLNAGGLRLADGWVRHKLLDCVGDLALCLARRVPRLAPGARHNAQAAPSALSDPARDSTVSPLLAPTQILSS